MDPLALQTFNPITTSPFKYILFISLNIVFQSIACAQVEDADIRITAPSVSENQTAGNTSLYNSVLMAFNIMPLDTQYIAFNAGHSLSVDMKNNLGIFVGNRVSYAQTGFEWEDYQAYLKRNQVVFLLKEEDQTLVSAMRPLHYFTTDALDSIKGMVATTDRAIVLPCPPETYVVVDFGIKEENKRMIKTFTNQEVTGNVASFMVGTLIQILNLSEFDLKRVRIKSY